MSAQLQSAGPDLEDEKRKRRAKAQGQKACNPCRIRKVKCSYQSPCRTCIERGHPELCVYEAPMKRIRLWPSPDPSDPLTPIAAWPPSKDDWDALCGRIAWLEEDLQALQGELGGTPSRRDATLITKEISVEEEPSRDVNIRYSLTGENVFLGANSVAAMAVALSQSSDSDAIQNLLDKSILPIFALENESATYPFVDLWGLPQSSTERIVRLCGLLPSDSECLQNLRYYRETAHVIFPGIVNVQRFTAEVVHFLMVRTAQSVDPNRLPLTEQNVYGRNVHWLGLLFACLASGSQCSNMQRRERQLTSQVYVCCAYECLRIINYLSYSQLDDIQSLLVLGNVISNSMNAGVAWTLLGLTTRLAQSLGLHRAPSSQTSLEETNLRYEIWSRIIWQDSLLSITYDRATSSTAMERLSLPPLPESEDFPYVECMLKLCTIALGIVCSRATSMSTQQELLQMEERRQEIWLIEQQQCAHLRDLSACTSMTHHLEHWNWHMHRSYVISELCRPILTKRKFHDEAKQRLRAICIEALIDTVGAFLKLHTLTIFARTSWAAVHRSLSSALLLGILKEPVRSERVRIMIDKLIAVMSSIELTDSSEVPAPITRTVAALTRLNMSESENSSLDGSTDSSEALPHAQVYNIIWGTPPSAASSVG